MAKKRSSSAGARTRKGKQPRTLPAGVPAATPGTSGEARTAAPKHPHRANPASARALPRATVVHGAGTPDAVAWFGVDVSSAKLVVARVVVFGLLALDALLQIRHAPRYGAGDFNVGQLAIFDAFGPGRVAYGACQLVIAYTLVLAALGIATRVMLPIATVLYAWLYFGSQLDSYQHHYLVSLLLFIACFVPWQRPVSTEPAFPTRRSWAVRLLLVQLAIMYLWAAISKLDPAWLDGHTLATQITGSMRGLIESTVGFKVAAIGVIGVELALAATVWMKRTWFIAAPLGILFHGSILLTGLEIGLFAYLMVAIYIVVIPDRIWVALAQTALVRDIRGWLGKLHDRQRSIDVGIAIAVGVGLALLTRLPHALTIAVIASAVPLALVLRAHRRREEASSAIGVAHVVAIALWLVVDRASSVTVDYYKFWGGSQRRLWGGSPDRAAHRDTAERAYRALIDVMPTEGTGHFQLGRLLITTARSEEGLAELHEAQRLDPANARPSIEEARWLAGKGQRSEAIAKAKEAVFADPSNQEARSLLDSLSGSRPAPKSGTDDDSDTQ